MGEEVGVRQDTLTSTLVPVCMTCRTVKNLPKPYSVFFSGGKGKKHCASKKKKKIDKSKRISMIL
jgi:hypothetical protein